MRKAQIRIGYNRERDEYVLYAKAKGETEWDYVIGCKCMRSEKDAPDAEPMFVSINLIEEVKKYISLGYEMVY